QMIRRSRNLALCLHLKPSLGRPNRRPFIESARIARAVKKCISPIELLLGPVEVPGTDRFPGSDLKCAKLQGRIRHSTGCIGLIQHLRCCAGWPVEEQACGVQFMPFGPQRVRCSCGTKRRVVVRIDLEDPYRQFWLTSLGEPPGS